MPLSSEDKFAAHSEFDAHLPSPDGITQDTVAGFVSALCFRPLENGEMIMRLAGEDGEMIDLRTNPVCAGRLAIDILDLINRNGWYDVDLIVGDQGSDIARIKPLNGGQFICEPAND
jgi:hypothetical protein